MTTSTATFLVYDGSAGQALDLYASVFDNMKADPVEHYARGGFTLNGQRFPAMTGQGA